MTGVQTCALPILGVIVNQGLPPGARVDGGVIHRLPLAGRVELANALRPAFLLAAGLCGAVFVISLLWVREVPLRRELAEDLPVPGEATPQTNVLRSET